MSAADQSGRPEEHEQRPFRPDEPPDWIIAAFYPEGFPRQNAQRGAYTATARFNVDHAWALKNLLDDETRHHRYVIKAQLKEHLRAIIREKHGIWRGSLFPDAAGAAETAAAAAFREWEGLAGGV